MYFVAPTLVLLLHRVSTLVSHPLSDVAIPVVNLTVQYGIETAREVARSDALSLNQER